jgi:hypothetical protein
MCPTKWNIWHSIAAFEQDTLIASQKELLASKQTKQPRRKPQCKKCGKLMKGHSATECAKIQSLQG